MSSDPNQPAPDWWQRQQEPKKEPEDQGTQDSQDSQATRQYPVERGRPAGQGYPPGQDPQATQRNPANQGYQDSQATRQYPLDRGRPADQGFPPGQQYPGDQGYAKGQGTAADQRYPAAQGYQGSRGTQDYPPSQGVPAAQGYQGAPAPRARRRRRRWPLITLIVIIVLLVVGDRAANAFAEDQMASQFQSSLELSGKPHVTIQGFPFLTQLAARDFHQVDINASNEAAGPGGQLEIKSLTATLHGMHIKSTTSTEIDDFSASALVTFTALAHAGNLPDGITLAADGPNRIKANIDLGPLGTGTATAQVTQVGSSKINIKLLDAGGLPTDALGNLVNFTISIPKLPAGVKIQSISVTEQGLRLTATGHNTTLSQ